MNNIYIKQCDLKKGNLVFQEERVNISTEPPHRILGYRNKRFLQNAENGILIRKHSLMTSSGRRKREQSTTERRGRERGREAGTGGMGKRGKVARGSGEVK